MSPDEPAGGAGSTPTSETRLEVQRCPNGHLQYPDHPVCSTCGARDARSVDLTAETGVVVTWTTSTATPVGVRAPNTIALVEFTLEGETVRALGGTTSQRIEIGDEVRPVPVDTLRESSAGIRHPASQAWDGVRFEPVE